MHRFIFIITFLFISAVAIAQKQLPDVNVIDDKGQAYPIKEILNDNIPIVLTFWYTTCKPCLMELGALSDCYDDWQEELKFKIVAVATDDSRSSSKVAPMAIGRGWPFTILLDTNEDLKRAMNVQTQPTLFVLDKEGKIVYSHIGYTPGSEEDVFDILSNLK